MGNGIQITNNKHIGSASFGDFVVNTNFNGGMKIYKIFTFAFGGELKLMSAYASLSARIQVEPHGLNYAPAYMAFKINKDATYGDSISAVYNNFTSVGGQGDFVNVDSQNITVGFDTNMNIRADFIRVMIFAENLETQF